MALRYQNMHLFDILRCNPAADRFSPMAEMLCPPSNFTSTGSNKMHACKQTSADNIFTGSPNMLSQLRLSKQTRPALPFMLLLIIGILCPPSWAHNDASNQNFDEFTSTIITNGQAIAICLHTALSEIRKQDSHVDHKLFKNYVALSKYQELAIAESIANHREDFQKLTPQMFCEKILIPEYLTAYRETASKRESERIPDLAPPGSQAIESDSLFIEQFHNNWGKHDLGHSDITVAALNTLDETTNLGEQDIALNPCGCRTSADLKLLVSRASQAPDLYRWTVISYHAHTEDHDWLKPEKHQEAVSDSQHKFLGVIESHTKTVRRLARIGEYAESAFHLGLIGHLVQDLFYHHGITLRQHAGLSYIGTFQNPDLPDGSADARETGQFRKGSPAEQLFHQATLATAKVFSAATQKLKPGEVSGLFEWENTGKYLRFKTLAEKLLGEEDISLTELLKYWALHFRFDSNSAELHEAMEINQPWSPMEMTARILTMISALP